MGRHRQAPLAVLINGLLTVWLQLTIVIPVRITIALFGIGFGLLQRLAGAAAPRDRPCPCGTTRARTIARADRRFVFARDGGRCVECGATDDLEIDHVVPFSRGGSNGVRNLQVLCRRCNRTKGSRL